MQVNMLEGYYINLNTREDRRNHIEENIKVHSLFKNVNRMNAIYNTEKSGLGCTLSHIECLKQIKMHREGKEECYLPKDYVIMEDDLCVLNVDNFNDFLKDFQMIREEDNWDVILMTPRGIKVIESSPNMMSSHNFSRIINSQTATGYIFKSKMIDILLGNFEQSYEKIMNNEEYIFSALDQNWKPLQKKYIFYYYDKIYAGQLPGWSDLENMHVNYNYGFLIQGQNFINEDKMKNE